MRVGGLYLYKSCSFELLGPGVTASEELRSTRTLWFEGPLLPIPASQQPEDYPRDMAGEVCIAADAQVGTRYGRLWTAEGAAGGLQFVVGDLPEIVEEEVEGDSIPAEVKLPMTINGRIFPHEDVDEWVLTARKGQSITAEVRAARLGSPLDARLEVLDPHGLRVAENDDADGPDSRLRFTAPEDGKYRLRIQDVNARGGPAYVYRLTLTADPVIDRVYPLGGRCGTRTLFRLQGQGAPLEGVAVDIPADAPRDLLHRVAIQGKLSNPVLLDVDDVSEHQEVEPNDAAGQARSVDLPCMLNGRIDRPGDVDCWRFEARKGQALMAELRARQLGSPLRGVLTIRAADGQVLARAEAANGQADPVLTFTAPADGTYCIGVADHFPKHGGAAYAYRLRMGQSIPDFRLRLAASRPERNGITADTVTLPRGGQAKLQVLAERQGGFAGPIALAVEGLPPGVSASKAVIAAGQNAAEITLTTTAFAALGTAHLVIRGSAAVSEQTVLRTATLPAARGEAAVDTVLLAVALKPPFKIVGDYDLRLAPRGSVFRRRYRIERNGYAGPLEVSLADHQARHLQGVTGPTVLVPPGATEFEYAVRLPPWMEMGRTSRACVMAVGVLHKGGRAYTVGYSSEGQNEQIIAVVETGRLAVETDCQSVAAVRGGRAIVGVRISRGKGLTGPVRLEVIRPDHMRGLAAEPVIIPADQRRASLTVRFVSGTLGPFNMPVVLRATLDSARGPVLAETKLEIVPDP